ncbi:hypothetical protein LJR219_003732 [Phenylobacterium sp. LjRoot219]|uniref:hypothetical protein n=1 Tax=Phenylobacterium sp. LjRoot219 TaxID=3342283 RepID=UPI003ECF2613
MTEVSVWRSALAAHTTRRRCNGCDLCCSIMGVRELQKPAFTPCAKLAGAGAGCSVWGEHPASCKSFACLWRGSDDLLPPELFPPDCGFLVELDPSPAWPTAVKVCPAPGRPDAWDTPRNRTLFASLAAAWNCPVVIVGEGVRASHVFAPTGRVYSRDQRPEIFPHDGAGLALSADDWGPDRRPPAERIAEAGFSWRRALLAGVAD